MDVRDSNTRKARVFSPHPYLPGANDGLTPAFMMHVEGTGDRSRQVESIASMPVHSGTLTAPFARVGQVPVVAMVLIRALPALALASGRGSLLDSKWTCPILLSCLSGDTPQSTFRRSQEQMPRALRIVDVAADRGVGERERVVGAGLAVRRLPGLTQRLDLQVSGEVNGNGVVGGLVGLMQGDASVTASYASGRVTAVAPTATSGFVGWVRVRSTITASFFDTEKTGFGSDQGVGTLITEGQVDVTGLPTARMQTADPFIEAGWDFEETSTITEGKTYPRMTVLEEAD